MAGREGQRTGEVDGLSLVEVGPSIERLFGLDPDRPSGRGAFV
jgi:hypothetical protein